MIRKSLLAAIAVTAFAALPAVASAATPPSLAGEALVVDPHAPLSHMSQSCSGTPSGTGTYSAAGPASGPYPGTFTEDGSWTYDSSVPPGTGSLTAKFTITSNDGSGNTVTGTASYPAPNPSFASFGVCAGGGAAFDAEAAYSATIQTSVGAFHDEGLSEVTDQCPCGFGHFFDTSLAGGPVPEAPTSKDQCKQGGWQQYGVFKNQGDCVSYVATGGKNAAG
jgi:hypothetical protein